MRATQMKNKDGQEMSKADGSPMVELRFEEGDEFIPCMNKLFERSIDANVNGVIKKIKHYTLMCRVRSKDGVPYINDLVKENEDKTISFVTLTPSQANSFSKVQDQNQNIWSVYKYTNEYGENLGIGLKKEFKKAKTFEDFKEE